MKQDDEKPETIWDRILIAGAAVLSMIFAAAVAEAQTPHVAPEASGVHASPASEAGVPVKH